MIRVFHDSSADITYVFYDDADAKVAKELWNRCRDKLRIFAYHIDVLWARRKLEELEKKASDGDDKILELLPEHVC